MREETRCDHYFPWNVHDSTYHSFCYTSYGELAETINSSMGPPDGIDVIIHRITSEISATEPRPAPDEKDWCTRLACSSREDCILTTRCVKHFFHRCFVKVLRNLLLKLENRLDKDIIFSSTENRSQDDYILRILTLFLFVIIIYTRDANAIQLFSYD